MAGIDVQVRDDREKPFWATLTKSVAGLENLRALKMVTGSLAAGAANAYMFAWQNPENVSIMVFRVMLRITTAGGTANSVGDVGSAATATTASDNLIDGCDLNATAPVIYDNTIDQGTNGRGMQILDAKDGTTDYITGRILVANASTLVGSYYIFYVPLS